MTYWEIAESDGKGTLVAHGVIKVPSNAPRAMLLDDNIAMTILTEQEALEWKDIHGGWVAV